MKTDWASNGVDCQGVDIAEYFYGQWTNRKGRDNDPRVNVMITEGMIVEERWAGVRTIERQQKSDDLFDANINLFQQWKKVAGETKLGTSGVLEIGVDIAHYFYKEWSKLNRFPEHARYVAMEKEGLIVDHKWAHKKPRGGKRRGGA